MSDYFSIVLFFALIDDWQRICYKYNQLLRLGYISNKKAHIIETEMSEEAHSLTLYSH